MGALDSFRQQYPGYGDMSDQALADALYGKFYSDMPRESFNAKMGLARTPTQLGESTEVTATGFENAQPPTAVPNFGAPAEPRSGLSYGGAPVNPQAFGVAAQGVPLLGGLIPDTQGMAEYKKQFPGTSAGLQTGAAMGAMAPAIAAAPIAFGAEAPAFMGAWPTALRYAGRLGIGSTVLGGTAAADQATREYAAPMTGQTPPRPSATFEALGLPSTGSEIANAGISAAAANAVLTPAASAIGRGAAWAVAPKITDSAALLRDAGVKLTPGMQVGGLANEAGNLRNSSPVLRHGRSAQGGASEFQPWRRESGAETA